MKIKDTIISNEKQGWITLHRKFLNWEWYSIIEMVHVFLHLILSANHEKSNWRGVEIPRGSFITSRGHLSQRLGLSEQTVRTCLGRLKSTNEITIKTTNQYTIITICNYDTYQFTPNNINQPVNQDINKQLTSDQPATNHKQQYNNDNNIKKEYDLSEFELYRNILEKWLKYKSSKNQKYRSQESINLLAKKLVTLSGNNVLKAEEIINQSIANNWSGIFQLNEKKPNGKEINHVFSSHQKPTYK